MSATATFKLYGLMTLVFLALDLLWIGVVASGFYQRQLGFLLRPDVRWGPAIVFYLLFVAAVLVFAVQPGLAQASLGRAALLGAFLGLVAYATYDLTSLALVDGFPTVVAVVDMAWGAFVAGVVASAGYGLARWLGV